MSAAQSAHRLVKGISMGTGDRDKGIGIREEGIALIPNPYPLTPCLKP